MRPASIAIATAPQMVAPGLTRCTSPNRSADTARAIQVPPRRSRSRKITPRNSTSSVTATVHIIPITVSAPASDPEPVTW